MDNKMREAFETERPVPGGLAWSETDRQYYAVSYEPKKQWDQFLRDWETWKLAYSSALSQEQEAEPDAVVTVDQVGRTTIRPLLRAGKELRDGQKLYTRPQPPKGEE